MNKPGESRFGTRSEFPRANELHALADSLDARSFIALSTGLGLGAPRAKALPKEPHRGQPLFAARETFGEAMKRVAREAVDVGASREAARLASLREEASFLAQRRAAADERVARGEKPRASASARAQMAGGAPPRASMPTVLAPSYAPPAPPSTLPDIAPRVATPSAPVGASAPVARANAAPRGATKSPKKPTRHERRIAAKRARDAAASVAANPPPRAPRTAPAASGQVARTSVAPAPPAPPARPRGGLERRLFAWMLDFLLVTATLAVAFAGVTVFAATHARGKGPLLDLPPLALVGGTRPLILLACVYGAWLFYMLFFKLVAGRTLGESLMRTATRGAPRANPAPTRR